MFDFGQKAGCIMFITGITGFITWLIKLDVIF